MSVRLASYEGRLAPATEGDKQIVWMSDKTPAGESAETVTAALLELKNNPYGIPLQHVIDAQMQDTTLVDIVDVYKDNFTQEVVAILKVKEQQTPIGADEQVSEEMVDESVEETFPASDPPALKSTP